MFEELNVFEKYRVSFFQIHQYKNFDIEIRFLSNKMLSENDKNKIKSLIISNVGEEIKVGFEKLFINDTKRKTLFITTDINKI